MQKRALLVLITLAVAAPQTAWASDMSGAMTMLFGIPTMVVALAIYGTLAAFRRLSTPIFYCAIALFVPLALFGLAMAMDAAGNWVREGGVNFISCFYYLLLLLVILCFAHMVRRRLR